MEWSGKGIVLSARPHGESSVILDILTDDRGRHAGVVRGGTSRKIAPILQPGALVDVTWRARLEEHLGAFQVEPLKSRSGILSDRLALAGLGSATSLLLFSLPERMELPIVYEATSQLFDLLDEGKDWLSDYVHWEVMLLEALGYGMDLSVCAVTGVQDNLVYVSPKTGRAVSENGAGEWASRLLNLPSVLLGEEGTPQECYEALKTTGHFIEAHLAPSVGKRYMPEARLRLLERVSMLT